MRQTIRLTFALAALLLAASAHAQTKELRGRVVGVSDGDTVTILDSANAQHRVRCQGIDAPERAQDFGEAAKKRMSELAFGRDVTVEYDKLDRYGRVVGKIMRGADDLCADLVWSGLAWHYKQYESEQTEGDRGYYSKGEEHARKLRRGLWQHPSPTPPWDFRRGRRDATEQGEVRATSADGRRADAAVSVAPAGGVVGNSNSRIYHWPSCPNYSQIAPSNRVAFASAGEAETAGYRAAKNCPSAAPETDAVRSSESATSASSPSSPGRVQVRGYYRKDGTYVRPHTRSAPRRRRN